MASENQLPPRGGSTSADTAPAAGANAGDEFDFSPVAYVVRPNNFPEHLLTEEALEDARQQGAPWFASLREMVGPHPARAATAPASPMARHTPSWRRARSSAGTHGMRMQFPPAGPPVGPLARWRGHWYREHDIDPGYDFTLELRATQLVPLSADGLATVPVMGRFVWDILGREAVRGELVVDVGRRVRQLRLAGVEVTGAVWPDRYELEVALDGAVAGRSFTFETTPWSGHIDDGACALVTPGFLRAYLAEQVGQGCDSACALAQALAPPLRAIASLPLTSAPGRAAEVDRARGGGANGAGSCGACRTDARTGGLAR
jgi:hypothetical protein